MFRPFILVVVVLFLSTEANPFSFAVGVNIFSLLEKQTNAHCLFSDTFINNPSSGSASQTILIPERNRSLKAIFHVQRPPSLAVSGAATISGTGGAVTLRYPWDSHALLESSTGISTATNLGRCSGNIQQFQFRIGGKYYPAQPVSLL